MGHVLSCQTMRRGLASNELTLTNEWCVSRREGERAPCTNRIVALVPARMLQNFDFVEFFMLFQCLGLFGCNVL